MFKKSIAILLGIVFLSATGVAAEIKVGFVDLLEVIQRSEAGKTAFEELSKEVMDIRKEAERQQQEVEAMRDELQKQSLVLSQEAKADKELEFKRKVRDFQDTYQSYQRQVKEKEEKYREPIITEIFELLQDYGKKNGYTMIMDKKGSGLTYIDESMEITEQIIVEFNKHWRSVKKDAN